MNKQFKQHKSIVPGKSNSTKVVNKDINFAIRNWKKQIKISGVLDILKTKQEFIKPSVTKKQILDSAKYKQYLQSLREE
jgi:ribosomal protein S21